MDTCQNCQSPENLRSYRDGFLCHSCWLNRRAISRRRNKIDREADAAEAARSRSRRAAEIAAEENAYARGVREV